MTPGQLALWNSMPPGWADGRPEAEVIADFQNGCAFDGLGTPAPADVSALLAGTSGAAGPDQVD